MPRLARNARPTATAPIRPTLEKESPMFDVDNKRAVDRLAAVVVMLERRERTAQQAYDEIRDRITEDELAQVPAMSQEEHDAEVSDLHATLARWTEARSALAAARELAPRDL